MPKGVKKGVVRPSDQIVLAGAKTFSDGTPLPDGISVRSRKAIQVDFYLLGRRCRETIEVVPTERAVREAATTREAVLIAVSRGQYVREAFFSPRKGSLSNKVIQKAGPAKMLSLLTSWLQLKKGNVGANSHEDYTKIVEHHLKPSFGHLEVSEVDLDVLVNFRTSLVDSGLSIKRIRNVMIPLRGAMELAMAKKAVEVSPFAFLPPLKGRAVKQIVTEGRGPENERFDEPLPSHFNGILPEDSDVNPLTPTERQAVLNQMSGEERNFFEFALWSGLRTGELIALRWCDVDFKGHRVFVRQSQSRKVLKGPKTAAGVRWVDLDERGWKPLEEQFGFTGAENERVFHNPRTGKPWAGDGRIRKRWTVLLARAKVAYRRPYQTRHTYASTLLSEGKNALYVAKQLGHKDWSMISKVYGRWIPEVGNQSAVLTSLTEEPPPK